MMSFTPVGCKSTFTSSARQRLTCYCLREDIDTALKIWGEKPYYRGQVARAYDLLHYTCKKPAEEYGRKAPNKEDPRLAAVYQPGFWLDKAKGLGAEMLGERLRTDPSAYFELRGELVSFWYK